MTTVLIVLAFVVPVVVLAAAAGAVVGRRRVPPRRRMRLHLVSEVGSDDATVEGIFLGYEAGHYRLAAAFHVQAQDDPIPLEGEAWVPRGRVLYGQIVG